MIQENAFMIPCADCNEPSIHIIHTKIGELHYVDYFCDDCT